MRLTVGTWKSRRTDGKMSNETFVYPQTCSVKVHRVLAEGCSEVLTAVFDRGLVLDRVLESTFMAHRKWGKRDRAFVAQTVFEVVRWRRRLAFFAADDSPAALCAAQWRLMGLEVPAWWMAWNEESFVQRQADLTHEPLAIRESLPDWLDERGRAELGAVCWEREMTASNARAPIWLRVNTLKMTRDQAIDWLAGEGIETRASSEMPDALEVIGRNVPAKLLGEGMVEIQDIGSQAVAPWLEVESGMKVIDACAGGGGKTLQLAAMMENRGEIIAMDVSERKLANLRKRAAHAGVSIIRTELVDETTIQQLHGWADRVLIDAPCSGLGTLRRQPDLKWRLTEPALEKTRRLQRRLLDHYPAMLKPGGQFVYATCSLLPSENEGQIRDLLERDGRFGLEAQLHRTPAKDASDGFFAARLRR